MPTKKKVSRKAPVKSHAKPAKREVSIITHNPEHNTLAVLFSTLIVVFIIGVIYIVSHQ